MSETPTSLPLVVSLAQDGAEWDAFLAVHEHATVDHLWAWRDVIKQSLGHGSEYLIARRGSQVVGALPLILVHSRIFGRSVVSMPFLNYGGILASESEATSALVDAARDVAIRFGATHVELRHIQRQCPDLPCRRHKLAMSMALPATSDAMWTALDRKVRNQVRKAQKENLEVVSGGRELVDEFYAVFAHNMRDLGTPVYPRDLFERTMRAFPEHARIFIVRHRGRAAAAGVSIAFGDRVLNPWASSLREFRSLNPNMLLYWAMLDHAVGTGARIFDFGRSSPDSGTHQFKLQWGAKAEQLHWEYVLLSRADVPQQDPSNSKFQWAIRAWQQLPVPVANVVGPWVARSLP